MSKTVIAAEQRHRTTQNLFLTWLGPFLPPAEGARARRHAMTPGRDWAEPLLKFQDEEYKGPWSIQLWYGAPP
jgi:hypothetical protein